MSIMDPISVIEAITRAANDRDVTAMLSFFADDAVLQLDPPLPPPIRPLYRGKLEIREYLQQLVWNGFHVRAGDFQVIANGVAWRSKASGEFFRRLGLDTVEISSIAIIQGSQIRSLTIHYSPEAVARMQAAQAVYA